MSTDRALPPTRNAPSTRSPCDARASWWIGERLGRLRREVGSGLRALPGPVVRVLVAWLVLGLVATAALTTAVTLAARAWAPHGLDAWDERALHAILEGPLSYVNAITLESPGNLVVLGPLVVGLSLLLAHGGRVLPALTLVASYGLARGLVFLGWGLWDRPRPALVADGIASPGLHSFPSGHALLTMSAYGFLAWLWMRRARTLGERALALLLCSAWLALIGWARLRLGTHWPSDVVAGWALGAVWLAFAATACARAETRAETLRRSPSEP